MKCLTCSAFAASTRFFPWIVSGSPPPVSDAVNKGNLYQLAASYITKFCVKLDDVPFVIPNTPYTPSKAFLRLSTSLKSAETTCTPFPDISTQQEFEQNMEQMREVCMIAPFALGESILRVTARTSYVPSRSRNSTTLPPCWPVAPVTATIGFDMILCRMMRQGQDRWGYFEVGSPLYTKMTSTKAFSPSNWVRWNYVSWEWIW